MKYAVIETISKIDEIAETNLIAITRSRDEAEKVLERYRNAHRDSEMEEGLEEEEYNEYIMESLDNVFDYVDYKGNEYHLLVCTPLE